MIFRFLPKPIEIVADSRDEAEEKLILMKRMRYDWECVECIVDNNVKGGD